MRGLSSVTNTPFTPELTIHTASEKRGARRVSGFSSEAGSHSKTGQDLRVRSSLVLIEITGLHL